MESIEKELAVLESIYNAPEPVRQRNLARMVGLSVGMTNAIVKRLAQKGWLKITKINNRNIHYVVSPRGMEEIARRSYRFFKRTIKNVVYYKETLQALAHDVANKGYTSMVLVGDSDLDFLVEHVCQKASLRFRRLADPRDIVAQPAKGFLVFSEQYRNSSKVGGGVALYLGDVLTTQTAGSAGQ